MLEKNKLYEIVVSSDKGYEKLSIKSKAVSKDIKSITDMIHRLVYRKLNEVINNSRYEDFYIKDTPIQYNNESLSKISSFSKFIISTKDDSYELMSIDIHIQEEDLVAIEKAVEKNIENTLQDILSFNYVFKNGFKENNND